MSLVVSHVWCKWEDVGWEVGEGGVGVVVVKARVPCLQVRLSLFDMKLIAFSIHLFYTGAEYISIGSQRWRFKFWAPRCQYQGTH